MRNADRRRAHLLAPVRLLPDPTRRHMHRANAWRRLVPGQPQRGFHGVEPRSTSSGSSATPLSNQCFGTKCRSMNGVAPLRGSTWYHQVVTPPYPSDPATSRLCLPRILTKPTPPVAPGEAARSCHGSHAYGLSSVSGCRRFPVEDPDECREPCPPPPLGRRALAYRPPRGMPLAVIYRSPSEPVAPQGAGPLHLQRHAARARGVPAREGRGSIPLPLIIARAISAAAFP